MKYRFIIIFIFLIVCNDVSAQLKFSGGFKPASLVIGKGDEIARIFLDDNEIQVDSAGYFVFGFDRSEGGTHYMKIKFNSGSSVIKRIVLPKRRYKIQRINNMKQKYVSPPSKENDRIIRERTISRQARSKIGKLKEALYRSGFVRPVKGGKITSVFGSQRVLNGVPKSPHNGIDIAVPRGTDVFAAADGIVRLAADNFYYAGNHILLDHGQGLSSVYLHLSKMTVAEGQSVKKGEKIGEVGTTGRSTGPHLHWGVQWFGNRIDPLCLFELDLSD